MTEQMTVIEFASKHCATYDDVSTETLTGHVNTIILAAITLNWSLWNVGVDSDGRASLIWVSLPEDVWEALLHEGLKARALFAVLSGLGL